MGIAIAGVFAFERNTSRRRPNDSGRNFLVGRFPLHRWHDRGDTLRISRRSDRQTTSHANHRDSSRGKNLQCLESNFASFILDFPPFQAFWLCVIFGNSVLQLCIGRVLAGIAGGGILRIVPLFVADIADSRIRGMLGSLLPVCLNLGTVLAFILGSFVSFRTLPLIVLVLPALFTLAIAFLPETPPCLLRAYRSEKAEQSLMFYRGVRGHFAKSECFRHEFQQLKDGIELETTASDAALSWKDFSKCAFFIVLRR